jgi:hypothetical protein
MDQSDLQFRPRSEFASEEEFRQYYEKIISLLKDESHKAYVRDILDHPFACSWQLVWLRSGTNITPYSPQSMDSIVLITMMLPTQISKGF